MQVRFTGPLPNSRRLPWMLLDYHCSIQDTPHTLPQCSTSRGAGRIRLCKTSSMRKRLKQLEPDGFGILKQLGPEELRGPKPETLPALNPKPYRAKGLGPFGVSRFQFEMLGPAYQLARAWQLTGLVLSRLHYHSRYFRETKLCAAYPNYGTCSQFLCNSPLYDRTQRSY